MPKASVIGSGPNGLSAAITLQQAGVETTLFEAGATVGGAARTAELTLPDFHHDLASSSYPLGIASPFFASLPLARYGHRWIEPSVPLAHPLDDGTAVLLERSIADTVVNLGQQGAGSSDAASWRSLFQPLVEDWPALTRELLGPMLHLPHSPLLLARFGLYAMLPATVLAKSAFRGSRARALFAGIAAHSAMPLTSAFSAATGMVLGAAGHAVGWPLAEGGAQSLSNALAAHFQELGGTLVLNHRVETLEEFSPLDTLLCDITPRQFLAIAGARLPARYRGQLEAYRYGPGTYKIDWALSEPIPWRANDCRRAATVHVGGSFEEVVAAEDSPGKGHANPKPFVLLVQPSLFDASRAPAGKHTAWGYCHVPNASTVPMTDAIEAQIERFAPGFRDCILARHVMPSAALEAWNPNLIGGDLSGGAMTPRQLLLRPTPSLYSTALPHVFLCSASTPPGGGVHGMCGHLAAKRALRKL